MGERRKKERRGSMKREMILGKMKKNQSIEGRRRKKKKEGISDSFLAYFPATKKKGFGGYRFPVPTNRNRK